MSRGYNNRTASCAPTSWDLGSTWDQVLPKCQTTAIERSSKDRIRVNVEIPYLTVTQCDTLRGGLFRMRSERENGPIVSNSRSASNLTLGMV